MPGWWHGSQSDSDSRPDSDWLSQRLRQTAAPLLSGQGRAPPILGHTKLPTERFLNMSSHGVGRIRLPMRREYKKKRISMQRTVKTSRDAVCGADVPVGDTRHSTTL